MRLIDLKRLFAFFALRLFTFDPLLLFSAENPGRGSLLKKTVHLANKGFFSFFAFLRIRHRQLLLGALILTPISFSGLGALVNALDDRTPCPDGYAYAVRTGVYIQCEDFDEYYEPGTSETARRALEFRRTNHEQ